MLNKYVVLLWKERQRILFALLIIAILFRVFSTMVVPEVAYNDSIYHLELAQQFIDGATITKEMPPFLYQLITAGFFRLTSLPMVWPFVKIIPLLVIFAQVFVAFKLFKKVFPKEYLVPTIFFTIFPWAVRIGSVNMVESFSILTVLLFVYAFYHLVHETDTTRWIVITALTFIPMALSKMNVVFILPVLLLGLLFVSINKIGYKKGIGIILLALIFSLSFILISAFAPASESALLGGDASSIRGLPGMRIDLITPQFFPLSYATFFDFPNTAAFEKLPFLNTLPYLGFLIIFLVVLLPLAWLIIKGIGTSFNNLKEKRNIENYFWVTIALGFIAALYPALTIIRQDILYVRYLLPVLPFIALLFGKAYDSSSEKSKKIAFVSLACLVLFSFAMTSVSAIFYNNVQQNNAPLYEFINSSNEFDSIISMHNSRALRYYTNKEVVTIGIGEYTIDWLTENHPSQYVAITCYNEDILTSIPGIVESEMTEIIFEEGCAKMLKVINN